MVCVARWFCRQEGASSCPCCRRESGAFDDVPRADGADSDSEDNSDEDDDDSSLVSVEVYWLRDSAGVWKQMFRETETTNDWNPVDEPDDVPEEIHEGALTLQRLWRGYRVRHQQAVLGAVEALLALKLQVSILEVDPVSFA